MWGFGVFVSQSVCVSCRNRDVGLQTVSAAMSGGHLSLSVSYLCLTPLLSIPGIYNGRVEIKGDREREGWRERVKRP